MRARTNATARRAEAPSNRVETKDGQEEADCNGKDKPNFKRPRAKFKLPPPPKMSSLSVRNGNGVINNKSEAESKVNAAFSDHDKSNVHSSGRNSSHHLDGNKSASSSITPAPPPAPAVPIPPPQPPISAVYQRANRKPQTAITADKSKHSAGSSESAAMTLPNTFNSDSYSNSYQVQQQQYHQPSTYPQISPYKPSSWYATARGTRDAQRKRQILKKVLRVVMIIAASVILWDQVFQQLASRQDVPGKKLHKNYHHHDRHQQRLGFAKEASHARKSYRQLEQEHTSSSNYQSHGGMQSSLQRQTGQTNAHPLFSTFPVTTLSNEKLLPYVGFGVSSRSVEHKQIPIIISTLLQYASSETEGGGGIAMIDAVIDEERKLENDGGSLQYSITNDVAQRFEDEEEKLESAMAKTVVTLVGRAINFFGKERNISRNLEITSPGGNSVTGGAYDYENRLEVHLLVGLSGPDLGVENTIAALNDFVAELDGIVPPFPKDALHTDLSKWKPPSSPTAVDHRVDVRLHVLLRLNNCHGLSHQVTPCSADRVANSELLENFIGSYSFLERLYEANIIHGIGLDGIHGQDIVFLLEKCKIQPQLYRGDVYRALDIYDGRHRYEQDEDTHIAKILKAKGITFLASNVAGHILDKKSMAPNAYALLQNLGGVLFRAHHDAQGGDTSIDTTGHKGEGQYYTVPRVVLSYLVRHKVCVLPHAYKAEHLADDAPESVGGLAGFLTERRVAEIGHALRALLTESDLPEDHGLGMEGEKEVAVVFHNLMAEDAHLFRVLTNDEVGGGNVEKEVEILPERGGLVKGGKSVVIISNTGDNFAAYSEADGQWRGTYSVTTAAGGADDFTISTNNMQ